LLSVSRYDLLLLLLWTFFFLLLKCQEDEKTDMAVIRQLLMS
jgi:hypothetical protein